MYEDYMQTLFGANFPPYMNTYEPFPRKDLEYNIAEHDCYSCSSPMPYNYSNRNSWEKDLVSGLEDLYPEIYKIVYPMVKKACEHITKPLTKELIEDLTNDIYSHLEEQTNINVNINIDSNNSVSNNRKSSIEKQKVEMASKNVSDQENRESRQFNNPLRDLVKILLIRELFDRPGYRPRPPRPVPPPPRPPRPGMPGMPPPPPPRPRYW